MYNFLYYFSLVYLAIAAVCCLAAWIVFFCDLKHFKEQLNKIPVQNPVVKFIIALLAPTIFGLSWIFFIPFLPYWKKGSK